MPKKRPSKPAIELDNGRSMSPKRSRSNTTAGYRRKARSEAKNRSTDPGTGKTWFSDSLWDEHYGEDAYGNRGEWAQQSYQKFTPRRTTRSKMAARRPKRAR